MVQLFQINSLRARSHRVPVGVPAMPAAAYSRNRTRGCSVGESNRIYHLCSRYFDPIDELHNLCTHGGSEMLQCMVGQSASPTQCGCMPAACGWPSRTAVIGHDIIIFAVLVLSFILRAVGFLSYTSRAPDSLPQTAIAHSTRWSAGCCWLRLLLLHA